MSLTTPQSFVLGLVIGIIVGFSIGFFIRAFLDKKSFEAESVLAWILSIIFISWHVLAGFGIMDEPPSVFDLVAGGGVGVVLGERFFNYLTSSISSILRK